MAQRLTFFSSKAFNSFFQHRRLQSTSKQEKSQCHEWPTLIGRDFIDPTNFVGKEFQDLLWTALDMKNIMRDKKIANLGLLEGKSVTLLLARPCIKSQIAIPNAAAMLGATCNTIIDEHWQRSESVADVGRFLSFQSDIIFCLGDDQKATCELANGSKQPVVGILSNKYTPLKGLTDLMTIYEYYGKLKRLKMGYLGPAGPLFNTYLTMLPTLGIDMQFLNGLCPKKGTDFKMLETALKLSQQHKTGLQECLTINQAIYRSDIIATITHKIEGLQITMKNISEANIDWVFMHSLPHTGVEATRDVFSDKRSLVYEAVSNTQWVAMALMVRLLQGYQLKIKRPDFNGDNMCV